MHSSPVHIAQADRCPGAAGGEQRGSTAREGSGAVSAGARLGRGANVRLAGVEHADCGMEEGAEVRHGDETDVSRRASAPVSRIRFTRA